MNPVNKILNELNVAFKDFDDKSLEISLEFFRKEKLRFNEYKSSEEYEAFSKEWRRKDVYYFYNYLFSMFGGKTAYRRLRDENLTRILEIAEKNHFSKIEKRNFKISKKLVDAGVTEVLSSNITTSSDGFNGFFEVVTDSGIKKIRIDTIFAGGYNIQCLHCRVLVKIF